MKNTIRLSLLAALAGSSLMYSCQREETKAPVQTPKIRYQIDEAPSSGISTANLRVSNVPLPSIYNSTNRYHTTLESTKDNNDGTYTWTWSVQNPKPGNGNGSTVQDLSHWSIVASNCCTCSSGLQLSDIVSAGTSTNGTNWQNFTPTVQQDPSILNNCNIATGPVLKFDVGTSGSSKTYYRLIVSRNFKVYEHATSYYKSGNKTGCGQMYFPGIGCVE
jgi:hypothetical protein